jgi:hypothetical protein
MHNIRMPAVFAPAGVLLACVLLVRSYCEHSTHRGTEHGRRAISVRGIR